MAAAQPRPRGVVGATAGETASALTPSSVLISTGYATVEAADLAGDTRSMSKLAGARAGVAAAHATVPDPGERASSVASCAARAAAN